MKESLTIDDIISKSNLKIFQTLTFTKKSLFYIFMGFALSFLGVLGDIEEFVPLIPGCYKSDKTVNITGMDKIHPKCDCIIGSIVNGFRESIFFSLPLDQPARHKKHKEPRIKLFKKVFKPFLPYISSYLEDNNHTPVGYNGELINFTCQLIKIL